jgi:hypothetical protein
MCVGRAIRISIEAERDWRAAREQPLGAEADQTAHDARARSLAGQRAGKLAVLSSRHISKRRSPGRGEHPDAC